MDEKIDSLLKEGRVVHPTAGTIAAAHIKDYESHYSRSIADPEGFWAKAAELIDEACGAAVVVTHDLNLAARYATALWVLAGGRLTARGRPD